MVNEIDELKRRAGIVNEAIDYKSWTEMPAEQAFQQLSQWNNSLSVKVGRGYVEFYVRNEPIMIIEAMGDNDVSALFNPEFID